MDHASFSIQGNGPENDLNKLWGIGSAAFRRDEF